MKSINKQARIIFSVILLLVFVAFNVVLFLATKDYAKGATFWTSYVFLDVAFLCVCGSTLLSTVKDRDGVLFALPFFLSSGIYLLLELAAGFGFMFTPNEVAVWAGVVQGLLLVGYIIVVLLSFLGILFIKRNRDHVAKKVRYIANLKDDVDAIALSEADPEVKKALEKLSSDIRYSDPMSHESLEPLEMELVDLVTEIEAEGDKAAKLEKIGKASLLLKKRNARARSLK